MSRKLEDIKLTLDETLEEKLQLLAPGFGTFRILRKSIDARRRGRVNQIYTVEVFDPEETPPDNSYPVEKISWSEDPVTIIGAGPAGLFAALRLVERGIPCRLIERGSNAADRLRHINRFWRHGELHPENNVCFGEGGAGLYSDGKLITRIKSPFIPYVMHRLVQFGAPEEIRYLSNPHVGSDRIRRVIPKIRKFLIENGVEIHFDTKLSELLVERGHVTGIKTQDGCTFKSSQVILGIGHSARDTIEQLYKQGVHMEGKSFAVGLRIEHPQELINRIQYREDADHPALGAANYRLAWHDETTGIGVYSFCMCPGGYVLSAGTERDGLVCNGMSNYHRNSKFANSAIVVSVDFEKNFSGNIFGGFELQRNLEKHAYQAVLEKGGTKEIPVQRAVDFLEDRPSKSALESSCPSGVKAIRLDKILPEFVSERIRAGLSIFESRMEGFTGAQAQLHGMETRTSCPVRITRDQDTLESLSHPGLYPVGEGAGYAGGITSAAVDGIRAVEAIVASVKTRA